MKKQIRLKSTLDCQLTLCGIFKWVENAVYFILLHQDSIKFYRILKHYKYFSIADILALQVFYFSVTGILALQVF